MYGWLNLLSLALGLLAWALPLLRLARLKHTTPVHRLHRACFVSFLCCALALVFQLHYQLHLVEIGDWSALQDTTYAVCLAAGVLLAGTALANLPLLLFSAGEDKDPHTGRAAAQPGKEEL